MKRKELRAIVREEIDKIRSLTEKNKKKRSIGKSNAKNRIKR